MGHNNLQVKRLINQSVVYTVQIISTGLIVFMFSIS